MQVTPKKADDLDDGLKMIMSQLWPANNAAVGQSDLERWERDLGKIRAAVVSAPEELEDQELADRIDGALTGCEDKKLRKFKGQKLVTFLTEAA